MYETQPGSEEEEQVYFPFEGGIETRTLIKAKKPTGLENSLDNNPERLSEETPERLPS